MRALIVGDTHADASFVSNVHKLARSSEESDNPVRCIVQLGDFGYTFDGNMMASICAWLDRHEDNIWYWVDGNHDHHDYLDLIRKDQDTTTPIALFEYHNRLFYVPRGAIFDIGETTCMGFGGAYSIDKSSRRAHVSWWPQEMPTKGDVYRALANFEDHGPIDVMFTHDAPCSDHLERWLDRYGYKVGPESKASRLLVTEVVDAVQPLHLYHGHYHQEYTTRYGVTYIQGVGANLTHNGGRQWHSDEVRVGDNVFIEEF